MNISKEDAQASISTIRSVKTQIQKASISAYTSPMLILWGTLWVIAFTANHYLIEYGQHIFTAMSIVGGLATVFVFYKLFHSKPPFRKEPSEHIGWRIAALWILLYVYIAIWLFLLSPNSGMQCNAFISTAGMFACIVMGLWFQSIFMVILGLAMTGITLVGFYLLTSYYCLWMGFVGGGTLLGTGLYIHIRWR